MIDITTRYRENVWEGTRISGEDIYFCKHILPTKTYKVPDKGIAAGFSQYEIDSARSTVGVHKPWRRDNRQRYSMENVEAKCPGVTLLSTLQRKVDKTLDFQESEDAVRRWDEFQDGVKGSSPLAIEKHKRALAELLYLSHAMYGKPAVPVAKTGLVEKNAVEVDDTHPAAPHLSLAKPSKNLLAPILNEYW
eukprot:gnl/MRDRNA2_/MRDRNA2_29637_c0_seq1.p1 gnl/MRDRNA2_/MRDRNA2_29637_c0~~gnl/MRDRNA2_/MRDRNA2_29637_c0_seq1.p1  ORF type:complete len:221 (+),score=26.14 gnl/MRDRNA2_/MRDRNA2_29637_c0_seq1:90-665(+)